MARGRKMGRTKRSRRAKRTMRKVRGRRCWSGGANQLVLPAPVANESYESALSSSSKMMLAQGNEYESIHHGQHGGAYTGNNSPAAPGYTGVLSENLRGQAGVNPLDQSTQAISGMSDMAGGRRRRRMSMSGGAMAVNLAPAAPGYTGMLDEGLRGQAGISPLDQSTQAASGMSDMAGGGRRRRSKSRKSRKSRSRKSRSRSRSRRMRGGAYSLNGAQDFGAPGMLLSPGQEARALESMNPEWKLATSADSFAPTLYK